MGTMVSSLKMEKYSGDVVRNLLQTNTKLKSMLQKFQKHQVDLDLSHILKQSF